MKRHTLTGPAYTTERGSTVIHYGPLCIMLEDGLEDYPRMLHQSEALSSYGDDLGSNIVSKEPDETVSIEIVEVSHDLYYPATDITCLEDAQKAGDAAHPVQLVLDTPDGDRRLTIHDEVHRVTLDDIADPDVFHRRQAEERILVTIDGNRRETVINREELNKWISDGRVEHLIPLDVTERAYQNI